MRAGRRGGEGLGEREGERFSVQQVVRAPRSPVAARADVGKGDEMTAQWIAYCSFHLGDHKKAADVYTKLLAQEGADPTLWNYLACCHFYQG